VARYEYVPTLMPARLRLAAAEPIDTVADTGVPTGLPEPSRRVNVVVPANIEPPEYVVEADTLTDESPTTTESSPPIAVLVAD
jgi:hypothetical protein